MKKRIAALLLIAVMLLTLAGCAKKVSVTIKNIGAFEVTKAPAGIVNMSSDEETIRLTINKDGEYPIVVTGEDGNEYTVLVKREKGDVDVTADGLEFVSIVK